MSDEHSLEDLFREDEDGYVLDEETGVITHDEHVAVTLPVVVTNPDGTDFAGMCVINWESSDPLAALIHLEVLTNSVWVNPEMYAGMRQGAMDQFPDLSDADFTVYCGLEDCTEQIECEGFAAYVAHEGENLLICCQCAGVLEESDMHEEVHEVSFPVLTGVLYNHDPGPEGAEVRIWQEDDEAFVLSLLNQSGILEVRGMIHQIKSFDEAVSQHIEKYGDHTVQYLEESFRAIEKLANGLGE